MKKIDAYIGKVKPLVGAIALTASAVGVVNAQPVVTVGGSLNASALASVSSSSISALNTSQAIDVGYSGEATISMPGQGGDPLQSVIDESLSGSGDQQSLPGLSDSFASPGESDQGGSANADFATRVLGEAEGTLQGMNQPSGSGLEATVSAVTETAAELAAGFDGAAPESPSPSQPAEQPDDEQATDESPSDKVADGSGGDRVSARISEVSEAVGELNAQGSSANANAATQLVGEATATIEGSDDSSVPGLEATASAVTEAAAELTASTGNASPDPSAPSQTGDEPQDEQAEEATDEVADSGARDDISARVSEASEAVGEINAQGSDMPQPQQPAPDGDMSRPELAAAAESNNRADAYLRF